MFLDVGPLRRSREFRLLYAGQTISFVGSMLTYVAIPYQVFQISHSSLWVGLLGTAQLAPLLVAALFGGALADAMDRRRLLLVSELALAACSAALVINARLAQPSLWALFVASAAMSAVNGFHRPALEAMTQEIVARDDQPAAAALGSLRFSLGAIGGPALAGLVMAKLGISAVYLLDVASFGASLVCLWAMLPLPRKPPEQTSALGSIAEGVRYAKSRQELVGTYVVDIVAMIFAMPMALFPLMSERWSGATAAGWLYAAMPIGSLVVTLFSGWSSRVKRHGALVVAAAAGWGLAIIALGFAPNLPSAVACLALAGGADMVSGLFRQTIWNQTIPTELRGRLSGLEMISYMTGPLLGNARAGYLATRFDARVSIVSGGLLCVAGVLAVGLLLPAFWSYRSDLLPSTGEREAEQVA
ncbi:MAG TPA: MFS transporter [Polyangiaceae bacterium]|nr:MFS transporter [Polyangiaceae bacterium]